MRVFLNRNHDDPKKDPIKVDYYPSRNELEKSGCSQCVEFHDDCDELQFEVLNKYNSLKILTESMKMDDYLSKKRIEKAAWDFV